MPSTSGYLCSNRKSHRNYLQSGCSCAPHNSTGPAGTALLGELAVLCGSCNATSLSQLACHDFDTLSLDEKASLLQSTEQLQWWLSPPRTSIRGWLGASSAGSQLCLHMREASGTFRS
eukprot:5651366-Amphidinium_carterae.1